MSDRRWRAGDDLWVDGVHYRVVKGRKSDDDLALEHFIAGEWRLVRMETGFLAGDFFFENEHVLYERKLGYHGGWKYVQAVHEAGLRGWETAAQWLEAEKRRARERRAS